MDVSGINATQNYGSTAQQDEDYARKRMQVFQNSSFQMGGSGLDLSALTQNGGDLTTAADDTQASRTLQLRDGSELEVPQLDAQQKTQVDGVYGKMPADTHPAVAQAALDAGTAAFKQVAAERNAANGAPDGQAQVAAATSTLHSSVSALVATVSQAQYQQPPAQLSQGQFNDAMTNAMTIGMSGVEQNLYGLMQTFENKQEESNNVDTDATELQGMINEWPDDGSTESFTYHDVETDSEGNESVSMKTVTLNKQQAEDLYNQLQTSSDNLSSLSTADTMRLQVAVQDYQQAMTTLSNVMKTYDDNLKGILANVKS